MNTQPANNYFDRICKTYEQFLQIKKELEGKGFKHDENYSTHEIDYEIYIDEVDEVFSEERPFPPDIGRVEALHRAREIHKFRNLVEERTWNLQDIGFEVVRTQAFGENGTKLDDLVAFFVKRKK